MRATCRKVGVDKKIAVAALPFLESGCIMRDRDRSAIAINRGTGPHMGLQFCSKTTPYMQLLETVEGHVRAHDLRKGGVVRVGDRNNKVKYHVFWTIRVNFQNCSVKALWRSVIVAYVYRGIIYWCRDLNCPCGISRTGFYGLLSIWLYYHW